MTPLELTRRRSDATGVVIAVDGPAAAGKGTLARRLAAHFDLRHLDSGTLYRAVAARLLREAGDPADAAAAEAAARALDETDLTAANLRDERSAAPRRSSRRFRRCGTR